MSDPVPRLRRPRAPPGTRRRNPDAAGTVGAEGGGAVDTLVGAVKRALDPLGAPSILKHSLSNVSIMRRMDTLLAYIAGATNAKYPGTAMSKNASEAYALLRSYLRIPAKMDNAYAHTGRDGVRLKSVSPHVVFAGTSPTFGATFKWLFDMTGWLSTGMLYRMLGVVVLVSFTNMAEVSKIATVCRNAAFPRLDPAIIARLALGVHSPEQSGALDFYAHDIADVLIAWHEAKSGAHPALGGLLLRARCLFLLMRLGLDVGANFADCVAFVHLVVDDDGGESAAALFRRLGERSRWSMLDAAAVEQLDFNRIAGNAHPYTPLRAVMLHGRLAGTDVPHADLAHVLPGDPQFWLSCYVTEAYVAEGIGSDAVRRSAWRSELERILAVVESVALEPEQPSDAASIVRRLKYAASDLLAMQTDFVNFGNIDGASFFLSGTSYPDITADDAGRIACTQKTPKNDMRVLRNGGVSLIHCNYATCDTAAAVEKAADDERRKGNTAIAKKASRVDMSFHGQTLVLYDAFFDQLFNIRIDSLLAEFTKSMESQWWNGWMTISTIVKAAAFAFEIAHPEVLWDFLDAATTAFMYGRMKLEQPSIRALCGNVHDMCRLWTVIIDRLCHTRCVKDDAFLLVQDKLRILLDLAARVMAPIATHSSFQYVRLDADPDMAAVLASMDAQVAAASTHPGIVPCVKVLTALMKAVAPLDSRKIGNLIASVFAKKGAERAAMQAVRDRVRAVFDTASTAEVTLVTVLRPAAELVLTRGFELLCWNACAPALAELHRFAFDKKKTKTPIDDKYAAVLAAAAGVYDDDGPGAGSEQQPDTVLFHANAIRRGRGEGGGQHDPAFIKSRRDAAHEEAKLRLTDAIDDLAGKVSQFVTDNHRRAMELRMQRGVISHVAMGNAVDDGPFRCVVHGGTSKDAMMGVPMRRGSAVLQTFARAQGRVLGYAMFQDSFFREDAIPTLLTSFEGVERSTVVRAVGKELKELLHACYGGEVPADLDACYYVPFALVENSGAVDARKERLDVARAAATALGGRSTAKNKSTLNGILSLCNFTTADVVDPTTNATLGFLLVEHTPPPSAARTDAAAPRCMHRLPARLGEGLESAAAATASGPG
jgi:hypothetical protein